MNSPGTYNFPSHYQNDGLSEFTLTLKYDDTTPVDLSGASIKMQLKESGKLGFEFSTSDNSLSILPDGVIKFNEIDSWDIESGQYRYDLQIEHANGFVRTYLQGFWMIKPDITK